MSAEDLWTHNLWCAYSLVAELLRGTASRANEAIFMTLKVTMANFCTKTTPNFNTVQNMHK